MKKVIIIALVVTAAGPAWAKSDNAGGVNGNGESTGEWCYRSIPITALLNRGPHFNPCWSNTWNH